VGKWGVVVINRKKKRSMFDTFAVGMAFMYCLLTSVVVYSAHAAHPDDNMFRTAVTWPWRLLAKGVAINYAPRQNRRRWEFKRVIMNHPVGGTIDRDGCHELEEHIRPDQRLRTKTARLVSPGLGHEMVALVEAEDAVEGTLHAHDQAGRILQPREVEEAVWKRVPG